MHQMGAAASSGEPSDYVTRFNVAVIGAGLGGIAAAYHLNRASIPFTVFEQASRPGGTWCRNTYPGCEVDVHSHQYSYSFVPNYDWPRTHNTQPVLQQYCEDVIDRFGLRRHFRFDTRVKRIIWHEERQRYTVELADGEQADYAVVISALGLFNQAKIPTWPGLDRFTRPKFHTAFWDHDQDLTGKRVAVVGTGSTAAQVVPAIAPIVEQLYVYQREPGWIVPKHARDYTAAERERFRRLPVITRTDRLHRFYVAGKRLSSYPQPNSKGLRELEAVARKFIHDAIDDPRVRDLVTPRYPIGCKRLVQDDNFYPTLNRANVELVPHAVTRVTETGLVDASGSEREVDVLVMATGYRTTKFLGSLEVIGREGRSIHDAWGDSETFLGLSVSGFPNFYMLYGPNSNGGGSIIANHERQMELVVRVLRRMRRASIGAVDTRQSATRAWITWLDRRLNQYGVVWAGGCRNYYYSDGGRNVTQLPLYGFGYWLVTNAASQLQPLWSRATPLPAMAVSDQRHLGLTHPVAVED